MVQTGKFQVYYKRVKSELEDIQASNNYMSLSKAFAHWYLLNFLDIDAHELGEIVIDGDGDNGIDAIIYKNDTMKLFQFKFPDKITNLSKQIDEKTALKLINGYKKLTSGRKPRKANDNFLNFRDTVKNKSIFNYEFVFVSFSDGLSDNSDDALQTELENIKKLTGNSLKIQVEDKKRICDKIDRLQKKNIVNLNMKYNSLAPSYNIDDNVKSWVGFTTAKDILKAVENNMDIIFDENIRNYEGDNSVNQGIINTATDEHEAENFYFYHNGIVFICDECKISTGNQITNLSAAAIVNGCQTVVALDKASKSEKGLKENVFLPIRIIETRDIDLRAKITEFLNSQTKIRDSYFLANNTFVRELQEELAKEGYFLERLANEYNYKHNLNSVSDYNKDHILQLEKTIQIYVAYYNNQSAAKAKRGKNELFDKQSINDLISEINSDKVLKVYDIYKEICKVITMYRKCRRVNRNDEFLDYMGIKVNDIDEYTKQMEKFIFVNTSDILFLNAYANISDGKFKKENLVKIINISKDIISSIPKMSPSSATKNTNIFEKVQKMCQAQKES